MALESALVLALTQAHFTTADNNEDFHLIINGSREDYLDVSYTYNKRGALVITVIHKLPIGWAVGFQAGEVNVNKFIISGDDKRGCIYELDAADPFASKAIAFQPE